MEVNKLLIKNLVIEAVGSKKIPRYFYKYRPIDSNLFKIIKFNQLWFSNPSDFNDPFDNQLTVISKLSNLSDIIKFVDLYFSQIPEYHKSLLIAKINSNPKTIEETIKKTLDKLIKTKGICCFSSINDNIPLWSYYSDSHKGVCLKFDLLKDPYFFSIPFKMIYQKEYPNFNYCLNPELMIDSLLKTKSLCWQHEQEVRVFKNNSGLIDFKKEALTQITFGCRASSENIKEVIKLVKDCNYPNISFKKALVKKFEFGFSFIDIESKKLHGPA